MIYDIYIQRASTRSDINEHLPALYSYATECNHIIECGVRGCNSSYAFAAALLNKPGARLVQYDIQKNPEMDQFLKHCLDSKISASLFIQSDIECDREKTDLLFIDTWHVYGHLKRELAYWHTYVSKYIIMHDTTVDEWVGESIRENMDIESQSKTTGIPIDEIKRGLWPAIEEFLSNHPEWELHERFTNNNGLTILRRIK